jgi:hypothetical protein
MAEPVPIVPLRCVCHGCRAVTYETVTDDTGPPRNRSIVLAGDGNSIRELMPGMMTSQPCGLCGESDDPGWLPGFVPPV